MNPRERSVLFYVLDALRSSPEQSRELLRLVEEDDASAEFKRRIRQLQAAGSPDAVKRVSEEVRAEIL